MFKINWIDKRVMPNLEYDISVYIIKNDNKTNKYKLRVIFRHGLENRISSSGLIKIGIDTDRERMYFAEADKKYYGFRFRYYRGVCMLETSSRLFANLVEFGGHYMVDVDPENGLVYIDLKRRKAR